MKKLADFDPRSPAEESLFKNAVSGEIAIISQTRPEKATNENTVRASFIRWLALGGDTEHPLHAHGVQLKGACIIEQLDLKNAQVNADLILANCNIETEIILTGMRLNCSLSLEGSLCAGITADRAQIAGSVFLRDDFICTRTVRLLGATIGGDLACNKATFSVPAGGNAIDAGRAQIAGNVFLSKGFVCMNRVWLLGATIGSDLDCSNSTFTVPIGQEAIVVNGALITGNVLLRDGFNCNTKVCLAASQIKGGLVFTNNPSAVCIDLSNAHAAFMQTDLAAWAADSHLAGFSYDGIREFNWSKQDCLNWLEKQRLNDYGNEAAPQFFKPQPWQQLIKTMRRMGHKQTADEIAIAFEQRLYDIGRVNGWFKRRLHRLFGKLAGYGYQPIRLVKYMLLVWFALGGFYMTAAYYGVFAPTDPLIFQNPAYNVCTPAGVDGAFNANLINNTASKGATHNWYTCGALKGEYTTFSPFIYSLDVILPLVDLGQEKAWGTFIDTPKPKLWNELTQISWNHATRCLIWFEILFGWIASLILVAVLTGLTNREK